MTAKVAHFHNILFGGDQLTVARARGASISSYKYLGVHVTSDLKWNCHIIGRVYS